MPTSWRLVRLVVIAALLAAVVFPLGVSPAAAQDGGDESAPVVIQGSNELEDLVIALRDAYVEANPDAEVTIDPRGGMNSGFDALCSGEVDIVMATEPISDAQIADCTGSGQDFVETVLAYEALVLLVSDEADLVCPPASEVYDLWQLGAPEDASWPLTIGTEALAGQPINFYGPEPTSPAYALFRSLLPANELREGIEQRELLDMLLDLSVPQSSGFGFATLAELNAIDFDAAEWNGSVVWAEEREEATSTALETYPDATGGLRVLDLQSAAGECVTATQATLGAGSYPLMRTDYLYVNAESAQRAGVQGFMQFVLEAPEGVQALAAEQGYTPAEDGSYEYGLSNVLTGNTGRTFTRPLTPVSVENDLAGMVTVTGTSMLAELTGTLAEPLATRYPNASVSQVIRSNDQGWQAFCQNEADVLQTTRMPTADEIALCEENDIELYEVNLGYNAQVIAVPTANDWLECLDADTAAAMLRAGTEDDPAAATWQDVNGDWPAEDLLLVLPPRNTGETDFFIFNVIGELGFALRDDVTTDTDPEYRAQGVGNTTNGLTYLWYSDYQGVEADVRLVPVGAECVAPEDDAIMDGSYPLGFPVRYYVNQAAFDNWMVRAFLWNLYDEDAIAEYATLNYLGLDVDAIKLVEREDVYDLLAQYEADNPATGAEDSESEDAEGADAETEDTEGADAESEDAGAGDAETEDTEGADAETEDAGAGDATEEAGAGTDSE